MYKVQEFGINTSGRDFVVGDIHGNFELLNSLLKKIDFNKRLDRIFSVGDLIDRGPDSIAVIDMLLEPWFYAVRGNHEQMLIDCISGYGDIARHTRNGGAWLYQLPSVTQKKLFSVLQSLPLMIEIELSDGRKIGVLHAETPLPDDNDTWQSAKDAISGRFGDAIQRLALGKALYARSKIETESASVIQGIDQIYVGHSTVTSVTDLGNVTYIDTGCSFDDGALTIVELSTQVVISVSMLQDGK